MSYEGETELWCEVGHYTVIDCNQELGQCHCGKRFVWTHDVDQTNCDGVYLQDLGMETLVSAVYEVCNLGHQHCTSEPRYAFPKEGHAI